MDCPASSRKNFRNRPVRFRLTVGFYYQIDRHNNAWKDVLATQTLSVRYKEELIGNLDDLPGQQRLEVVFRDKMAILEVSLFAVPKRMAADRGK